MDHGNLFSIFVRCCALGGQHGWHERNSGGMSMLLDAGTVVDLEAGLDLKGDFQPLGICVPELAKEFILATGGEQFLDAARDFPDEVCGIVQISPDGSGYRIVLGFNTGGHPSENFLSHLMVHAYNLRRSRSAHSVVYHCHPANLVALTYLLPLEDEAFHRILCAASPHLTHAFPDGVGVVSELAHDPVQLARATSEKIQHHSAVIWAFHGLVVSGSSLLETIGNVEVIEKAAEIRLKLLQVPGGTRQEPTLWN